MEHGFGHTCTVIGTLAAVASDAMKTIVSRMNSASIAVAVLPSPACLQVGDFDQSTRDTEQRDCSRQW